MVTSNRRERKRNIGGSRTQNKEEEERAGRMAEKMVAKERKRYKPPASCFYQ